jgi:hypothetical protein
MPKPLVLSSPVTIINNFLKGIKAHSLIGTTVSNYGVCAVYDYLTDHHLVHMDKNSVGNEDIGCDMSTV